MSRIGSQIVSIRNQKGITQKQLAKKLGLSEKIVSELESGKRIINEDLIKKISKVLGQDIDDTIIYDNEEITDKEDFQDDNGFKEEKIQEKWSDALSSILKSVPVYDYSLNKILYTKQLPIVSNKVDGYSKDKVLFLKIQDNDMIGFRIGKGDIAFGYTTHEIENNSICLIEYNNKRLIRQVKKIDENKILLINNRGSVDTQTVSKKDIKILVKLNRIEIQL